MQERIQHFGIWIKKSEKNKINRENYAVINKCNSVWSPSTPARYSDPQERKKYFEDNECTLYCDSYCEELQEKCLINYDKNMEYFKQIPKDTFDAALQHLINSHKKIKQVFDLNSCNGMTGIYVMVLDEYKQVYIGQAKNIKSRIMQHWNRTKPLDRLLFGDVDSSVISIDSFGALDTTRIFVLETQSQNLSEISMIKKIPACFRLNRIGGGNINNSLDFLIALKDWNLRSLKDFHNDAYAEKYEKELDVTYFHVQECADSQILSAGDYVCIEQTQNNTDSTVKHYGKIAKVNKTRMYVYIYCGPTLGNSCYSSKYKNKKLYPEEIRIKKNMRFTKVNIIEKKETHIFWRSKKFPHLQA